MVRSISHICGLWLLGLLVLIVPADAAHHRGHVRQYYIAADEIDWDYMPERARRNDAAHAAQRLREILC